MTSSVLKKLNSRPAQILCGAIIFTFLASPHSLARSRSRLPANQEGNSSQKKIPLGHEVAETPAAVLEKKVPSGLLHLQGKTDYYPPYAFVVDKKARTIAIWQNEKDLLRQVAIHPADFGKNWGVKQETGDLRTPEGIYFLQELLEGPSLDFSQYGSRAYTTDYPNFFDRREGRTGSGIWLHAVPDTVSLARGSQGCVVVRNKVITNLEQYINLSKTPLIIEESVEYISADKLMARNQELQNTIESWRSAWESKDIESYISYYSDSFQAQKMNRDQWKSYKGRLNQNYKTLSVKFSTPVIFSSKDLVVARFIQSYTSDMHSDLGEKTLYLKAEGSKYKILGEDWRADETSLARQELESPLPKTAVGSCSPGDGCPTQATTAN